MKRSRISSLLSQSSPCWLRWCSIATLGASIGFLCVSLSTYNYRSTSGRSVVPSLFLVLIFATFLNVHSLWRFRNEHRKTDQAFRNTDCECSSIFQNVLDGILIANDRGDCLDANPAAAGILRCSLNELLGQNIRRFLADTDAFTQGWDTFLRGKSQRGRARLIAGDGIALYVDFTAAANYLPGR